LTFKASHLILFYKNLAVNFAGNVQVTLMCNYCRHM